MKDHMRTDPYRRINSRCGNVTTPTPSLTDQNVYVAGETVVQVTLIGRVVRVMPAGNGRSLLKIDTAPDNEPDAGQFLSIITDDPTISVEVL